MPNAKLCADKISSFFLSLYPNDMAPKHLFSKFFLLFFLLFGEKSRYLWHLLRYLRNSYRFGIRFQNGFVWAPQNDRSLNISYPDIFTHSIFKRNFWFCKIHLWNKTYLHSNWEKKNYKNLSFVWRERRKKKKKFGKFWKILSNLEEFKKKSQIRLG